METLASVRSISVEIHGILRWLILLVALAGIVRTAIGLARKEEFGKLDNGLSSGYSGMLDLQMLLGILQIILLLALKSGSIARLVLHPVVMFVVVVAGHLSAAFKKRESAVRFKVQLGIYLGSLVLIVLGLIIVGAI
jgi:hypothetical protein